MSKTTITVRVFTVGDDKSHCMARMFLPSGQSLGDSLLVAGCDDAAQMSAVGQCVAWLRENRPTWDIAVEPLGLTLRAKAA